MVIEIHVQTLCTTTMRRVPQHGLWLDGCLPILGTSPQPHLTVWESPNDNVSCSTACGRISTACGLLATTSVASSCPRVNAFRDLLCRDQGLFPGLGPGPIDPHPRCGLRLIGLQSHLFGASGDVAPRRRTSCASFAVSLGLHWV